MDEFYVDKARSGVTENRRALRKLLRECKARKIEAIIVASLDRLSRDLRLTENLLFEFDRLGVRVLIADMPYYDGSNQKRRAIETDWEAIAEENRKEIIERLKKGREERTLKGKMAGGTLPYGYRRKGKGITKDTGEAGVVRVIFYLKQDRKSGRTIADYLNDLGHRQRNGRHWTQRQVSAILSREKLYRFGFFRYGKVEGKNEDYVIL